MADYSNVLQTHILKALDDKTPLAITGSGSKQFYGRDIVGTVLNTSEHTGIINYEPKELVVTARCGTPLKELKQVLSAQGQMLAFEPPEFTDHDTLGGTIACGFSGARRPYVGAARDYVLGVRMINGHGEILSFGGEVMKNVAGYDVSRLMVGALGTLGVILDVSLKVLPVPEHEETYVLSCSVTEAITLMNQWAASTVPLSAACYVDDLLYFRLSGTVSAVTAARQKTGGDVFLDGKHFWYSINTLTHSFFAQADMPGNVLWRLSVAPDTKPLNLKGKQLMDWGGAQRWLISDDSMDSIREVVARYGGHATQFRGADRCSDIFHPLAKGLAVVHRQLKQAFDPQGIFNIGRLYQDY